MKTYQLQEKVNNITLTIDSVKPPQNTYASRDYYIADLGNISKSIRIDEYYKNIKVSINDYGKKQYIPVWVGIIEAVDLNVLKGELHFKYHAKYKGNSMFLIIADIATILAIKVYKATPFKKIQLFEHRVETVHVQETDTI